MSPILIVAMVLLAAASTESKYINPNQKNAFLDKVHKIGKIDTCEGCLNWIGTVEDMIENGYIHDEIIAEMFAFCMIIGDFYPIIGSTCLVFVHDMDEILDDIIDGIFPPEHVCCEMVHVCEGEVCGATTAQPATETPAISGEQYGR